MLINKWRLKKNFYFTTPMDLLSNAKNNLKNYIITGKYINAYLNVKKYWVAFRSYMCMYRM